GARRRALHRLAGRVLFARGRLGDAAAHFAQSAEIGDPETIEALRDAVRQAERQEAHQEALTILNTLVELLPRGDPRWLDVFDAMSWEAEWVVDHRADAKAAMGIRAMRAIDSLLESDSDPRRRAIVKFRLTNFLAWGSSDLGMAEITCRQALKLFDQAGDRVGALLAANELAWITGLRGGLAHMKPQAQRVVADAEAAGEPL